MAVVAVEHFTAFYLVLVPVSVTAVVWGAVILMKHREISRWLRPRDVTVKVRMGGIRLGFKTKKRQ